MHTYLSLNGLARRIDVPPKTAANRLRARGIKPDGIVIGGGKAPGFLFSTDRLPELRRKLATTREATA
jgi:hypothetical protein